MEAGPLFEQAVAIYKKVAPPNDPDLATSISNLGFKSPSDRNLPCTVCWGSVFRWRFERFTTSGHARHRPALSASDDQNNGLDPSELLRGLSFTLIVNARGFSSQAQVS